MSLTDTAPLREVKNLSRDGGAVPRQAHNLKAPVQFRLPQHIRKTMLFTYWFWFGKIENMAKKLTHTIYQYTAVFEPDEKEGGFTVTIPALPGCISEGDTFEKALQNIKEAASLYLEVMQSKKEEKGVVIAPVEVLV